MKTWIWILFLFEKKQLKLLLIDWLTSDEYYANILSNKISFSIKCPIHLNAAFKDDSTCDEVACIRQKINKTWNSVYWNIEKKKKLSDAINNIEKEK